MTTPLNRYPGVSPPVAPSAPPRASIYRPGNCRAAAALVTAALLCASELGAAALVVPASRQMIAAAHGGSGFAPDYSAAYYLVATATTALGAVSYVITCLWLWRARCNSEALAPGHRHTLARGWVWGAWVVPVVSLWFPHKVVRDIARATRTPVSTDGPSDRTVGLWWGSWLAWLVAAQVGGRLIPWNGDPGPAAARALVWVQMVEAVLAVLALVFWAAVVRGVRRSQNRAATRLLPPSPSDLRAPMPARAGAAWMLLAFPLLAIALFGFVATAMVAGLYQTVMTPAGAPDSGNSAKEASPAGAGSTNRGDTLIEDLAEGDCLARELPSQIPEVVEVVPCAKRHVHEVYAVFDLPAGPFPGERTARAQADRRCVAEFTAFVGIPFRRSELDVVYLIPDQERWRSDRSVVCLASGPQPTQGSYAGSRR